MSVMSRLVAQSGDLRKQTDQECNNGVRRVRWPYFAVRPLVVVERGGRSRRYGSEGSQPGEEGGRRKGAGHSDTALLYTEHETEGKRAVVTVFTKSPMV